MTIRSMISKKKRKISIIVYSGGGIFIVGAPLSTINDNILFVALFGLGVAFIAMLYAFFVIACPRCKGSWGHIAMYSGRPFSISKKIKFCPYCGVSLDSDL